MQAKATYDSVEGTFTIEKGICKGAFPLTHLPKWLNFYSQQMQRYPAHAPSYTEDVKALEALAAAARRESAHPDTTSSRITFAQASANNLASAAVYGRPRCITPPGLRTCSLPAQC